MPQLDFETTLATTPTELYSWHVRPGAFERLAPPWQIFEVTRPAPVESGSVVELRLKKGPLWLHWTAEHRGVVPGEGFVDVQTSGPFARWIHHHEFSPHADGARLRDRIDYRPPAGWLGSALAGRRIRHDIEATFAFRHETTARDLARHARFSHVPRLRVALTGASGLMGSSLAPFLTTGGHEVLSLRRRRPDSPAAADWDPTSGLLAAETLGPVDAVVHLAGENIAGGRWTSARKGRIRASRVEGTRNLVASLARLPEPPKTLVCASAIGYYGSQGDTPLDEESPAGSGFLAEVCEEWEAAARAAAEFGTRVVVLRFGVILTPAGGALGQMLPPFLLGLGGPVGDGRQFMSWISIDDAVGIIHRALLDERLSGPFNAVAPRPVTHREFTKTLGKVLRRPTFLPVPKPVARAVFGEMADEMLLSSARVLPTRLEAAGFRPLDRDLEQTLARLLGKVTLP